MKFSKDIQGRLNHTFNTGIMLVLNAVPDLCLYLDGANCNYEKAMSIERAHDMFSSLMQRDGKHRLFCGGRCEDRYIHNRYETVNEHLTKVLQEKRYNGVMILPMAMSMATAFDFENICVRLKEITDKSVIFIASESYEKDWIDAYDEGMLKLAQALTLKKGKTDTHKVQLVGHFFDRWEGDNLGNLKVIKNILSALGLELEMTWLDGRKYEHFVTEVEAGLLVSLPYGRKTAKWLAQKLSIDLLELELPIGLMGTQKFIRSIAKASGKEKDADELITKELERVIPRVDRVVPAHAMNKKFVIGSDKNLVKALSNAIGEIGGVISKKIILGKDEAGDKYEDGAMFAPYYSEVFELDLKDIDYVIANSQIKNILDYREEEKTWKYVNVGYPSEFYHCLSDQPYMGFDGWLNFISRIVNSN